MDLRPLRMRAASLAASSPASIEEGGGSRGPGHLQARGLRVVGPQGPAGSAVHRPWPKSMPCPNR